METKHKIVLGILAGVLVIGLTVGYVISGMGVGQRSSASCVWSGKWPQEIKVNGTIYQCEDAHPYCNWRESSCCRRENGAYVDCVKMPHEPEPEPEPVCIDTDCGINHYVKGTVTGRNGTATDACSGNNWVMEAACTHRGDVSSGNAYNCAHEGKTCVDGACV